MKGVRLRHVFLMSCGEQPGQSGEVVGGHRQDEAGPHPFDAAIDGLRHTANGFGPAEGLFNPFAVLEWRDFCATCGVTQAWRRSATNPAAS